MRTPVTRGLSPGDTDRNSGMVKVLGDRGDRATFITDMSRVMRNRPAPKVKSTPLAV
jgi:hypothetical protein